MILKKLVTLDSQYDPVEAAQGHKAESASHLRQRFHTLHYVRLSPIEAVPPLGMVPILYHLAAARPLATVPAGSESVVVGVKNSLDADVQARELTSAFCRYYLWSVSVIVSGDVQTSVVLKLASPRHRVSDRYPTMRNLPWKSSSSEHLKFRLLNNQDHPVRSLLRSDSITNVANPRFPLVVEGVANRQADR